MYPQFMTYSVSPNVALAPQGALGSAAGGFIGNHLGNWIGGYGDIGRQVGSTLGNLLPFSATPDAALQPMMVRSAMEAFRNIAYGVIANVVYEYTRQQQNAQQNQNAQQQNQNAQQQNQNAQQQNQNAQQQNQNAQQQNAQQPTTRQ